MRQIDTGYRPQPKQVMLHQCEANEILYGGAAGPGKSHALRHEALDWCLRIPGLHAYLFRRTYPELEDNHIIPSLKEFPKEIGKYRDQKHRWEFSNGSMLHFGHCQYDKDVFQYLGSEIHLLLIDELTMFTDFMYDFLQGRVRCPLPIPEKYRHKIPGIVCASNPGGIGHAWVKARWIDYLGPYEIKQAPEAEGSMFRCFIPGKLADNPILSISDPTYINRLDALPEPYRTAYKDGNWDIFIGQAFDFNKTYHMIDPVPIPDYSQLWMTMDWGFGAPFSIGWWWADNDGRVYRFGEWYGWEGIPNRGMRMTDDQIAMGIKEREADLGITEQRVLRLAGPDCFQKRPDYKGGGQGPSTAEVFAKHGLFLAPGDVDRKHKIRAFRDRLQIPKDGSRPMMQIYSICTQFIRTIPLLQADIKDVEDVDTTGEDHCYDEACHICMARPRSIPIEQTYQRQIEDRYQPLDPVAGV